MPLAKIKNTVKAANDNKAIMQSLNLPLSSNFTGIPLDIFLTLNEDKVIAKNIKISKIPYK